MKEITQLYTEIFRGIFGASRRLIFIAEGYTASDEAVFYKDVYEILEKLGTRFPFSLLKGNGNNKMFSAFMSFTPSSQSGYASSQSQAVGRTVFETYVFDNQLYINFDKVNSYIDDLIYTDGDNELNYINGGVNKGLSEITNGISIVGSHTLIFIVLPKAYRSDLELEITDSNTYYSIVTSADNNVEQVVLRSVAKILSLGDEFDLPGNEQLTPTEIQGDAILLLFRNLYYSPNINIGPNPNTDELFPWRNFFDKNYDYPVPVNNTLNPNVINRNLPAERVTYTEIELWEGAGRFRKDVYRSAEDCLMRRRIGDTSIPVKNHKVSFCPLCRELLSVLFTQM